MEIFIIFFVAIAVLLIGIVAFKNIRKNLSVNQNEIQLSDNHKLTVVNDLSDDLQIQFEILPVTQQIEETKLVEIKDSKVLARVNNLVPGIFQAGTVAGNVIQGNAQELYQVIIPVGAKLTQSQDMAGAVRGIYHGTEGIRGHANFVAVNNSTNIASNTAASAMGLASIIVGQYYMTQINAELTTISEGISHIADFQDNEYKSKVFALVTQIKKILSFQAEILENDELRAVEITNLNNLEQQCIELLGQANLMIAGYSKKGNLAFNEYEEEMIGVQHWHIYQKTLLDVLYRIADLKHTLHLGSVSREQCGALLSTYSKQVKDAIAQLNKWHKFQVEKHGINTDVNIRKRVGFDGLIHKLPGMIKEDYNFRPLSERTADIITAQVNGYEPPRKMETVDLFQKDVRVIAKKGRLYYLPENDTTQNTAF